MTAFARDRLMFFLGGSDLEMQTIRALLLEIVPDRIQDKGLGWGARASAYREEIGQAFAAGRTPVLVELEDDLGLALGVVVVADHHGERAGADRPTSLHQVFVLLALPPGRWTRWFDLVAANDRGHIAEMVAMGASAEEISRVRAADRAAQGITPDEDQAGEHVARDPETVASGRLTLVRLPHARTATVTDRLDPALGGTGFQNLLVLSPAEANFYGSGELVMALDARFPGGWYGGALPERGFWGRSGDGDEVLLSLSNGLP